MRLIIALLILAFPASIYYAAPYPVPAVALVLAVAAIVVELLYTGPGRVIKRELEFKVLKQEVISVLQEIKHRIDADEPRVVPPKLSELQLLIRDRRHLRAAERGVAKEKAAYVPNAKLLEQVVDDLLEAGRVTMQEQGYEKNKRYSIVSGAEPAFA